MLFCTLAAHCDFTSSRNVDAYDAIEYPAESLFTIVFLFNVTRNGHWFPQYFFLNKFKYREITVSIHTKDAIHLSFSRLIRK